MGKPTQKMANLKTLFNSKFKQTVFNVESFIGTEQLPKTEAPTLMISHKSTTVIVKKCIESTTPSTPYTTTPTTTHYTTTPTTPYTTTPSTTHYTTTPTTTHYTTTPPTTHYTTTPHSD